jgi:hypothetical protein
VSSPYKYSVDDSVLTAFASASRRQREELLRIFDFLAANPFLAADSPQRDHTGRICKINRFGRWRVTWWAEHLSNQVHVLDVDRLL